MRPERGGFRKSKPSDFERFVSESSSPRRPRALLLQPGDLRQLRLRLLRLVLLVAEALDEALEAGDVDLVAGDGLAGGDRPRRLLAAPLVPRPAEEERPPGLQLEHGGRHRLEEPAVVGDEDDRGVERRERSSSHSRLRTSRWFVGSSSSRRSGSPASALPSDARVSSPPENVSSWRSKSSSLKAEPSEARGRPLAPVPAAGVLEPALRLGVSAERRALVVSAGHRGLERPQIVFERDQVRSAGQRVLTQRQPLLQRRALVVERDARALREGDLSGGHARLAHEHAQQRRLPRAVRARERDDVPAFDAERDAVEQRGARMLFT